jgi:exopolyphosphatase/guanosine-5'-triphosphate,3'-diphosphate pyrophosphatase
MTLSTQESQQQDSNYFAALDIGSNSFHFVLARQVHQHLQILHSEKYKVKLATGLDENNKLSNEAIMRGIATLTCLCSSTSHLDNTNFRVVATHTLREAKNFVEFLSIAKQVFPFDIEVISGHEEARLIYAGVNYHSASTAQRLILDIGGGSTECIIGQQEKVHALASLPIGCVSYSETYFANKKISKSQFNAAISAAKLAIAPIAKRYKKLSWQEVIGTSGTIKAVYQTLNHNQHIKQPISLKQLRTLQQQLIACKHADAINIDGLKAGRNPVISAGVAILIALMEALSISEIDYCKYALREGVLYEQLKNINHNDTRQRTISSLTSRFNVDTAQLTLVKTHAEHLFSQVAKAWRFTKNIYQELLMSAVHLHEIGFDINSSSYQKHGEYILSNADLAGFNQEQQQALAWLVGNQRKNINDCFSHHWLQLDPHLLLKLLVILRLSIILSQQRFSSDVMPLANISKQTLLLQFDLPWLTERPLIDKTLKHEQQLLAQHGFTISISER